METFLGLDFTRVGREGGGNLTTLFQRVETCPARVGLLDITSLKNFLCLCSMLASRARNPV